jgi:flavin-dependent dehydrogenase
MIYDLAVIGGGPAGCAAAIIAARNGARVLLLERGRFPRHKVCGEFVSAESLDLLNHLLPGAQTLISQATQIRKARVFLDGQIVHANVTPAAASISRYDLDAALWNTCLAAGVPAVAETAVHKVTGESPFELDAINEVFEARAVLNTSGRWSNFTSPAIRSQSNGSKWLGLKAHFHEQSTPESVDLYFFEGGYCGVQPVKHGANGEGMQINACAMVRADVASTISDVFRLHHSLFDRSRDWTPATEPVATSPLVFHDPEPVHNSLLQAGDAATFVDPFIGDGISLAMRSGAMAAECLIPFFQARISLGQALHDYSRRYQRDLARVFTASSKLRGFLQWPKLVRKPVISVLARAPFLTRQIVRMTR